MKVAGSVKVQKNLTIDTRNGKTAELAKWTGNVSHGNDGTLTLSVSGNFTMDSPLTGGSASASFKCTDIARATEISLSAARVNPGGSFTASLSPAVNTFSHELTVKLGNSSLKKTAAAGVKSISVTVPKSWANELTASKSGAISLSLVTKNGSSEVGTKTGSIIFAIPETEEYLPDFTVKTSAVSESVPQEWGVYVKGKGYVKIELDDVTYRFGASYASVSVTAFGVTKRESPAEIALTKAGTNKISVTLRDSRGMTKTKEVSIAVEDYAPPSVEFTSLYRCKGDGTPDKSGTYLAAEFTKKVSAVSDKNTASVTLTYKKSGSSTFVTVGNASSPTVFGEGGISVSASYDVKLCISDLVEEKSFEFSRRISSADIPFNIRSGGRGAAFGCYAENDNELTVAYDLNVLGSIKTDSIEDDLTPSENVSEVIGKIKLSKPLGLAFFNLRFTLNKAVSKNTEINLGTLTEVRPWCLSPLGVRVYLSGKAYDSIECRAFLTYKSELKMRCSEDVESGTWVYISGAVINVKEEI